MANTEYNDENGFLAIASLGAIIGFVIPLIMWALKKDSFSDYTKIFLTDLLNFELVLFIINIVLYMIPFLGWLLGMLVFIVNLIVALRCYSATKVRAEYSFPINVKLIN